MLIKQIKYEKLFAVLTSTNGIGQRTGMSDPSGSTQFDYDNRGRLTGKTININGCVTSLNVASTYSPAGRISSKTYPSGRTMDFTYNAVGKVETVETTGSGISTTLVDTPYYLPFGPSAGPNDVYDELYRLTVANNGAETQRSYSYDNNGNITGITFDQMQGSKYQDQAFSYDNNMRLLTVEGRYGDVSYVYDKVGYRLVKIKNGLGEGYYSVSGTNKIDYIDVGGEYNIPYTYVLIVKL